MNDTLLAEAGAYASIIERFRGGKSEHNMYSLEAYTKKSGEDLNRTVKALVELGFLEVIGESYKIPMLYREGLSVTQGKAFS